MAKKTTAYRSAKSGRFTTKTKADSSPSTHVKETIKKSDSGKKKG